ncbi:MAG: PqqD family peptide modification chaperone, partial [Candidatus Thermoplasmatota archaeon]|nr:PqqD family peptide modification chaperone [Candidatus Thermoplasmatota archaeon]
MKINGIPKRFNRPFMITRKEKHHNKNVMLLCSDLSNELLELNTSESIRLLELCDGKRTVADIINVLANELGISASEIRDDTLKLLDTLEKYRFIFYDDKRLYEFTMRGSSGRPFLDYLQKNGMTHFSAPLNVRFLTTLRCDGRCRYCYLSAGRTGLKRFRNEMTTEQIKKLMDQCDKFGAVSLGFMGGEPFLRKDAIELIDYSLKLKIFTPTSTNGIILSDK